MAAGAERTALNDRLIDVTADLLATEGTEALSLREIARRAGVSHGAPLRHYPSLANLLAHVAAEGFARLKDFIDAALVLMPEATAVERLGAAGRAYVAFAMANPGHFTLMFRNDLLDGTEETLLSNGATAFDQLVQLVELAQRDGWHADDDRLALAGVLWSTVHGIASLWLMGALGATTGAAGVDTITDLALATLFDTTSTSTTTRRKHR
jgi:AcrR family transcriptional regulator